MQSGMFEHYLNGIQVDEPFGWRDFRQVYERDEDRRFIGLKYEGEVTFAGSGYDVLRQLKADNYCGLVAYRVFQNCDGDWQEAFYANIILTEIDWNVTRCTAAVTCADSSYGSYIVNNDQIKFRPTTPKSKTGVEIGASVYDGVYVFDPNAVIGDYINENNPSNQPGPPVMWDWLEAMTHAVRFVSDGNIVGCVSDWYDTLPDDYVDNYGQKMAITTGYLLRNVNTIDAFSTFNKERAPEYNLQDLWLNVAKKYDLWSAIELYYDGTYRLRIEPRNYFFGDNALNHPWIQDLIQTNDPAQFFGRINVGTSETIRGVKTDASMPYLLLFGFTTENYSVPIQCNTANALDLLGDFVTDSNVFETTIIGNDDQYDEDVFLCQHWTAFGGAKFATKGDFINPGVAPYQYNPDLTNEKILNRYSLLGAAQFIDQNTDGFRADEPAFGPIQSVLVNPGNTFDPPSPIQHRFRYDYVTPNSPNAFDTSDNYGNGTTQGTPVTLPNSRYTAPLAGYYKFQCQIPFRALRNELITGTGAPRRIRLRVLCERYDATNILLETPLDYETPAAQQITTGGSVANPPIWEVYMNATDYVVIKYQFIIINAAWYSFNASWELELQTGAQALGPNGNVVGAYYPWWRTTYIEGFGGNVIAPEPDAVRGTLFKYQRPVNLQDWLQLVGNPALGINVSPDDRPSILAHVKKATRTVNSGAVEWELIAPTSKTFIG